MPNIHSWWVPQICWLKGSKMRNKIVIDERLTPLLLHKLNRIKLTLALNPEPLAGCAVVRGWRRIAMRN